MGTILEPFVWLLGLLINLYTMVVVAEIVLHWLIHFKVVSTDNKYVAKAVELLTKLTQKAYGKISEKVPPFSGFDFSPFVLLLILMFVGRVVYRIDVALM